MMRDWAVRRVRRTQALVILMVLSLAHLPWCSSTSWSGPAAAPVVAETWATARGQRGAAHVRTLRLRGGADVRHATESVRHPHEASLGGTRMVVAPGPAGAGVDMDGEMGPHGIRIRQAILADVPHLQRINLVCLPENYHQQSYWFHILRWPTLIRVAEARMPGSSSGGSSDGKGTADTDEWTVVAYVLAKIEESSSSADGEPGGGNGVMPSLGSTPIDTEPGGSGHAKGHITSLAVMRSHRRLGIAKRLMESALKQMESEYKAISCGLHVRSGNQAALPLYRDMLGFHVAKTEKAYYGDGEDALSMIASLTPS